ncbi:hypothetical protein K2Z83_07855, partial [Oscillochloris sp. ZM17-4]
MAEDQPSSPEPPPQAAFDPLASNWLTEEPGITDDDDRTVAADWAVGTDAQAETIAADNIPEWLRDVAPESFDSPDGESSPRDAGGLPSWLDAPEDDNLPSSFDNSDVPDWLRDVSGEEAEGTTEDQLGAPQSTGEMSDPDVPAWLRDAEPSPATPPPAGDDVPAWL